MPRPKRKEIKFTNESALSLMQEIYNECVEQRTTAIRIQNKMISFMKEAADMSLIGPVLKEQQKIIDSAIEKKLQLSKLQSTLVMKGSSTGPSDSATLSLDDREMLNTLINKNNNEEGESKNYNM